MDFAFAIMVASLPALYRPLDTVFDQIRKLVRSTMPRLWSSRGISYKSSIHKLVGEKPHPAPSSFDDRRGKSDIEGGNDILLSSPAHMSSYHQSGLMEGQLTVMACGQKLGYAELAHTDSEEHLWKTDS